MEFQVGLILALKTDLTHLLILVCCYQRQTHTKEGVQIREQIRKAPEEGCRIQLP